MQAEASVRRERRACANPVLCSPPGGAWALCDLRAVGLGFVVLLPLLMALAALLPFLRKWWWRHVLFAIEGCGPTAVKLAQWSATRPDVFPEAWCVPASRIMRGDGVR